MNKHQNHSYYYCDALIIGAGSAGLRSAIEAHDACAHVLIISKSKRGDPHTTLADIIIKCIVDSLAKQN